MLRRTWSPGHLHAVETARVNSSLSKTNRLKTFLESGPSFIDFVSGSGKDEANPNERQSTDSKSPRLPEWLKTPIATGSRFATLKSSLRELGLHTVCEEARCPNIGECWGGSSASDTGAEHISTATIMLMGDECTRGCRFCSVKTARTPKPLDPNEPEHVAQAIAKWGLKYAVLTAVDRDDLPDGGAEHFAKTVRLLLEKNPKILVECLTGDFQGNTEHVHAVASSGLHVYAHNLETVERLTPFVRDHRANYRQTLAVLSYVNERFPHLITKSSIMLGFGESDDEIVQTFKDLKEANVDCVTLGQYMRPTKRHMQVSEYVHPDKFKHWQQIGEEEFGFAYVAAGPLVRSSYRAGELYLSKIIKERLAKHI